jgi:hypothetical protein
MTYEYLTNSRERIASRITIESFSENISWLSKNDKCLYRNLYLGIFLRKVEVVYIFYN